MRLLQNLFGREPSSLAVYKKLGYRNDQEGILRRFLREEEGWRAHLEHSKQSIREFYAGKNYKSIAILGSGWLLDVPIDDLLRDFEHIYLVDISHPRQITHKYRHAHNLHFVECDLTGGWARHIYRCVYEKKFYTSADVFDCTPQKLSLPQFDCVVSLNLLNQLDGLLLDAMEDCMVLTDSEIERFKTLVQTQHIQFLSNYKYCLISDCEQISISKIDNSREEKSLVFTPATLPPLRHEWLWNFDSQGHYQSDTIVQFRVKAFF
ncbi:MAG: hypothetical protein LBU90_00080 [Bacteroidales bacterium]|jgi:hypothetical protein|nr:hypothetical protein [Bacteroidales bacterium]